LGRILFSLSGRALVQARAAGYGLQMGGWLAVTTVQAAF